MRTVDFERVLATKPRCRSAHFAAHHLPARPTLPGGGRRRTSTDKLSTGDPATCPLSVDQCLDHWWLGLVVPKRFARRAVTRNLLKRQIRALMMEAVNAPSAPGFAPAPLPGGLWVVRLKAQFDKMLFRSASSAALRDVVRNELRELLGRAKAR